MHKLFESQRDDEKIFLVIREHPILPALRLLFVFGLFLIGLAAEFFIPRLLPTVVNGAILSDLSLVIHIYYLGLLLGALLLFIFFYLSVQIVTEMRMVDVDQAGIFRRKVTEIQIENVEEVTSRSHGVLATIFNFGDVTVQTSSAEVDFVFENVAHPEEVKKIILDIYEQYKRLGHRNPRPINLPTPLT